MVRRSRGVVKIIRRLAGKKTGLKFVTAGDTACRSMMLEARSRKQPGPSDQAIQAWANYDLAREIMTGFWEFQAA